MDSEDRTTPVSVEERSEPPSGPAETPTREPAPEDADQSMIGTMQGLLSDTATEFRTLQRGDVVEGVVVSADRDGVLVDIGMKSEGIVPTGEAQGLLDRDEIRVGEEVLVYVIQPEDQEGHVVLSLNRARSERGWRTMQ